MGSPYGYAGQRPEPLSVLGRAERAGPSPRECGSYLPYGRADSPGSDRPRPDHGMFLAHGRGDRPYGRATARLGRPHDSDHRTRERRAAEDAFGPPRGTAARAPRAFAGAAPVSAAPGGRPDLIR
ncbi:hypothetical protein [Streptomyces wuyuanensis]|uniref:hypothetical protein n=1 Tax=Streptomyces wuyuanensis TaxID=1196353 RepID=UPI003414B89B